MKSFGICNFCGENKPLCKAHILPKWCYKLLYPSNRIEGESIIAVSLDGKTILKRRQGTYDNKILCSECDDLFSKYESYAYKVLNDKNLELYSSSKRGKLYKFICNPKPEWLRIFFHILLYRMSITKLHDFKNLVFPSELAELVKSELTECIKGGMKYDKDLYPVLLLKYKPDIYGFHRNIMVAPYTNRLQGRSYLHLSSLGNGFYAVIKLNNFKKEDIFEQFSLNNPMQTVLSFEAIDKNVLFKKFVNMHKNSG